MILLPSPEDFSTASGIINISFLNSLYKSLIDESFLDMGRPIILHLPPVKEQDANTQSQNQPSQYNPYFGRVQAPITNRRNTGVTITERDIQFTAHIKIGPLSEGNDTTGIGNLAANQVAVTLHISALPFIKKAQSMSIEGRRYDIDKNRPIGLIERSYIIVFGTEIDDPTIDNSRNAG